MGQTLSQKPPVDGSGGASARSAESVAATAPEGAELPLDVVYHLLSNQRRRWTLKYLLDNPEGTTLGDLADVIASLENDKPEGSVTSQERKRIYICLYQAHLPKMADADIVEYDADRKTIEPGPTMEQVTRFLPPVAGTSQPDDRPSLWDEVKSVGSRFLHRRLPLSG